jgi:hypothetical protein
MGHNTKVATLIVAFARPENLRIQLEQLMEEEELVYIFIDRAHELSPNTGLNSATLNVALEFQKAFPFLIVVEFSEISHGVRNGVPAALNWFRLVAAKTLEIVVIREDDILIYDLDEYRTYIRFCKKVLNSSNQIASLLSPFDFLDEVNEVRECTLSRYPLTWGWVTRIEYISALTEPGISWQSEIRTGKFLRIFLELPIGFMYFLSAHIRRNHEYNTAWDGAFCFRLLLSGSLCIIPNKSLVTNVGNDNVRNHDFKSSSSGEVFLNKPSKISLNPRLDTTRISRLATEKKIENHIYNFKPRHFLSPVKALLIR